MNIKAINTAITSVGTSEKNVKQRVPVIVADLFAMYVDGGQAATNVALANRLLEKLTPMNRKLVLSVFRIHLPFSFDEETEKFGKMLQGKRHAKRIQLMTEYVENGVNVWDYAKAEKAKSPETKISRVEKVGKTIKTALESKKDPLTVEQLAEALKESGVSVSELVARLQN